MPDKEFRTGETVPKSGIYRVTHKRHRLPHEVTLLGGQLFPRCSKCKDAVEFHVVRQAVPIQSDSSFKVAVYELPVVDDDEPPKKIAS